MYQGRSQVQVRSRFVDVEAAFWQADVVFGIAVRPRGRFHHFKGVCVCIYAWVMGVVLGVIVGVVAFVGLRRAVVPIGEDYGVVANCATAAASARVRALIRYGVLRRRALPVIDQVGGQVVPDCYPVGFAL